MSQRFYCPDPPRDGRYQLAGDEARHLARVSRHGPGDLVEVFDGKGFATRARVLSASPSRVELAAEGEPLAVVSPPYRLTLATAVPKGDRFDWLVEKTTELGVTRLIPLSTERSVVDPRESKLDRLRRTIIEACKQCRRSDLMMLEPTRSWSELVRTEARGGRRLVALQSGLRPEDWPAIAGGSEVLLAVGPEGGLSPSEVELALRCGWDPVCLGPHVLRVETAGIAGIAAVWAHRHEEGADGMA